MKGKIEWLKQGYFVLLPELDELGRTIMYVIVWALPFIVHIMCTFSLLICFSLIDMEMPLRCPRTKQWRKW